MNTFKKATLSAAVSAMLSIPLFAAAADLSQPGVSEIQGIVSATAADTNTNVWLDANGLNIVLPGIRPADVADFEWNGSTITYEIKSLTDDGLVTVTTDEYGDLLITVAPEQADRFNDGQLGVVLANGARIVVTLAQDVAPLDGEVAAPVEQSRASYTVKAGTATCNKYSSSGNPYPCCDNDGGGVTGVYDGNCTWWAWDQMKKNWTTYPTTSWGNANTWDNNAKAVNRTTGWVVLPGIPMVNSIAVDENSLHSLGHVGRVESLGSTTLSLSEMLCGAKVQQPRSKSYSKSTFENFIVGLYIYDWWVKTTSLIADPNASVSKPNFDAQFKLKNVTKNQKFTLQNIALAVHNSNGQYLFDMFRAPGSTQPAVFTPSELSAGAADGLDPNEYLQVPKSYAFFKTKGTYKIVAKIKINSTWVHVGEYTLTVR
ncbi:MAG TPA: CHAP domain-containing protein [Candidatus Competibacter sp.]|nr:CHAP domain-containing protein [Candidatus Competibacteraceae bacterium]HPE71525.1 CHAP domain-containing protein [Candidatus Competibacter sp.]HRW64457.1 CHAP domain-containing protein [Candidatus Competibacter sp.]